MKKKKILITAALPYANGPLHFGHIAGAYLPADCYARFERLQNNDVAFICGSDEYGIAITLSAELAGRSPQEHVDLFHRINSDLFKQLNISFDHFSRTTWEGHFEPTQQFFKDLLANGYIEERITEQLYSDEDQRFLADRYVVGTCPRCGFEQARGDECPKCGASYEALDLKNPRSKLTQAPLSKKETKHWFLLLEKFKERLNHWISTKNWKPNVVNFIRGYIDHLHARAITRDSTWGIPIPLPHTEGKVLYVWFDAPIGYISATKEWAELKGFPDLWKEYWLDSETTLINFMGKDNIPFHASIFPAMVMGQNQPYKLVDELVANEFYNLEGRQFSKSDGWSIDLEDFFKNFIPDQIRYAIASNAPETSDSEFSWKDFQQRCNADLLGKYGNLVNRVLVFIYQRCSGIIPPLEDSLLETSDRDFLQQIHERVDQVAEAYTHFKLRKACQIIMEIAQLGNGYFDSKRPWADVKQEETKQRMQITLACCCECLKVLTLVSFPVIPNTSERLWSLLGFNTSFTQEKWGRLKERRIPPNQPIPQPAVLFQKIEDVTIESEIAKLHASIKQPVNTNSMQNNTKKPLTPFKPEITIEDFNKIDLRVGQIISAERLPKSKKLLKLSVDIGLEKRVIISGIGETYKPEELIGKQAIIVANLKPATLMGIESSGMLLAGKSDELLRILTINDIAPGGIIN